MKKNVLFVCVQNSARSQIAEAFARIHGGDCPLIRAQGNAKIGRLPIQKTGISSIFGRSAI
jgi:protein-tyrosine-phosphatase